MPVRSIYRAHRGHEFHWFEAGEPDGPLVLLVHGFMAHSMAFRRVIEPLGRRFRLVLPDLPGHGLDRSYRRSVEPRIESLAHWLRDFRSLFDEDAHLVGHSLGATLLHSLARDGVGARTLTLVAPGLRIPPSSLVSYALDRFPASVATLGANRFGLAVYGPLNWRGDAMNRIEAEAYLRPLRDPSRAAFMLKLGARLLEVRPPAPIGPLEIPAQVVWGELDHILPLEDAHWVADRLGGVALHIIEGSGHSPMEDRPAEFANVLSRFLD